MVGYYITMASSNERRRLYDTVVVFARPEDIEPWALCEGCGNRGPDAAVMDEDAKCRNCGGWDWYSVPCNYVVSCSCEQDGCNASDCATCARDGTCPLCGRPAGVREGIIAEPIDNYYAPYPNAIVDFVNQHRMIRQEIP